MLDRLLIFGIGYFIGTRAGRESMDELIESAKRLAERDEVKMVLSIVSGFVEERINQQADRVRAA